MRVITFFVQPSRGRGVISTSHGHNRSRCGLADTKGSVGERANCELGALYHIAYTRLFAPDSVCATSRGEALRFPMAEGGH